jgi:hypothetical protein
METTAGSSAKWNQPKYRAVGYTSYVDETLFGCRSVTKVSQQDDLCL